MGTMALPICTSGTRGMTTTSPLTLSRARSSSRARPASFGISAVTILRSALTLTSRPLAVAVRATSLSPSLAARVRATSKAGASAGTRTGQRSRSSRSWLRAAMKPAVATPSRRRA